MKRIPTIILITISVVIFTGCQTRSISDSGYRKDYSFRGELSELEVLGVSASKDVSESMIQEALMKVGTVNLSRSEKVVVVQSGSQFPDQGVVSEMEKYYQVIPLSGVPNRSNTLNRWDQSNQNKGEETTPLDLAFRLAAAKANAKTLIVFWGILESSREGYASKTVSWVPIVGSFVPDEDQQMRIRLKVAVIDVASGYWEMMTPEIYDDERSSMRLTRESQDQKQVELLKEKAYMRMVADLRTRYEK
ncbi:MAG: hypothetical protein ABS34_10505 [Opitutaceae bacterium BACL24 MAG-120322-bin51]|jgi:hypothetical protein|nr:MAG: hypothetical protein ABS34_10505 [Opitutaceae bacterium BACL24 MAG-120322-bin51]